MYNKIFVPIPADPATFHLQIDGVTVIDHETGDPSVFTQEEVRERVSRRTVNMLDLKKTDDTWTLSGL